MEKAVIGHSILLLLLAAANLPAQIGESRLPRVTLTPRDEKQIIEIEVPKPPTPNDDLVLWSPTRKVNVTLISPQGKRITEPTASGAGLDWLETRPPVDSSDTNSDSAKTISIRFRDFQETGKYQFELAPLELQRIVELTAAFRPEVGGGIPGMPNLPAASSQPVAIYRGPGKCDGKGTLDWPLEIDEEGATIDILTTNPAAKVTLLIPQGLTLDANQARRYGIGWQITDDPASLDAPGGLVSISGFYLKEKGTHHMIHFPRAVRGVYRAIVDSPPPCEMRVGFFPTGRLAQAAFDVFERVAQQPTSEVKLALDPLPATLHVGDSVPITVEFTGEPVRRQVNFEATIEYSAPGAPPLTRTMTMPFSWSLDNSFRAYFQPERPGKLKIALKAMGRTVTGVPFTVPVESAIVDVKPLAARLLGIWEQARDVDGNGRPDRLEVMLEMEVMRAGEYRMAMRLFDRANQSRFVQVNQNLPVGRQTVIFPFTAAQILALPLDGPYFAGNLEIALRQPDGSEDSIQTHGIRITTQAYKKTQWQQ
ncbi:MAG: hypothetical protein JNK48_30570 [Bryobacterales bacterium]|nr:hypothetical protein [Bryobacterales bacterium]